MQKFTANGRQYQPANWCTANKCCSQNPILLHVKHVFHYNNETFHHNDQFLLFDTCHIDMNLYHTNTMECWFQIFDHHKCTCTPTTNTRNVWLRVLCSKKQKMFPEFSHFLSFCSSLLYRVDLFVFCCCTTFQYFFSPVYLLMRSDFNRPWMIFSPPKPFKSTTLSVIFTITILYRAVICLLNIKQTQTYFIHRKSLK